jgi:hypothetical protein
VVSVTESKGHVFVIHGDLLKLACDAVLVPSDISLVVEDYWGRWNLDRRDLPVLKKPERRVTEAVQIGDQRIRYVNIGSVPEWADLDWLRAGIKAGLSSAVEDFRANPVALHDRERPLVGMPILGVGEGGYDQKRGDALAVLLEEASAGADAGLDVGIVCFDRSDYAALQSRRWDVTGAKSELPSELEDIADRLGREVKDHGIALFLGAGVSRAAGLPSWQDLLTALAPEELAATSEFKGLVADHPPRAASRLKEVLRGGFEEALRAELSTESYGLTHGLLASLRVGEVLTTNIDGLYELAAIRPLWPEELSVLPWERMPGRPPWLLKMHGDLKNADLVFTEEDYGTFEEHHGVLGAVLQALLITRHLVFVGYSLRDENFVDLANEVVRTLEASKAPHTRIGTVLSLAGAPADSARQREGGFEIVPVGGDGPEITRADCRLLEIFLDRVAWRASEDKWSWILDDRYLHLLNEPSDRRFAQILKNLEIPRTSKWNGLLGLLRSYGMERVGEDI